jgi:hypothetical protein
MKGAIMREDLIKAVAFTILARRLGKLIKLAEDETNKVVKEAIQEDQMFLKQQLKRLL